MSRTLIYTTTGLKQRRLAEFVSTSVDGLKKTVVRRAGTFADHASREQMSDG